MGNAQSVRSSQEEQIRQIDGGSLTLETGVYTTTQDWKKSAVRALQLSRKLAPYYKGLEDYDSSWSSEKLISVLRKTLEPTPYNQALLHSVNDPAGSSNLSSVQHSGVATPTRPSSIVDEESSPASRSQRSRAATVDGQSLSRPRIPFGALLYHNAVECPICFLFYPSNIATTRCCRQPICTECFVQIRRPNPHPPIVHADDSNPPSELPGTLIMEAAVCPYCNQSDFGVIYEAPNFNLPRTPFQPLPATERDIPAMDKRVVLIDHIRPEWEAKLQRAKDRAARRAANAALITAHLQRQERRASEARLRAGGRVRRRDAEAFEQEQLAEAIRLSMLDDEQRRSTQATPAPVAAVVTRTSASDHAFSVVAPPILTQEDGTLHQSPPPVDMVGPSAARQSTDSYSRGIGSVPMPELIYGPPPDSYDPRTQRASMSNPFDDDVKHVMDSLRRTESTSLNAQRAAGPPNGGRLAGPEAVPSRSRATSLLPTPGAQDDQHEETH